VELEDAGGRLIASKTHRFESSGVIPGGSDWLANQVAEVPLGRWDDLAGAKRFRLTLAAAGGVPAALRPLTDEERARAQALIAQFGDPQFDVRQQAVEELVKMGPAVLPLIRQTLAETKDNEVKLRCEMVIEGIGVPPEKTSRDEQLPGSRRI
jgi:hypothetical protein